MIECEGKVYVYSTGGGGKSSPDGLVWTSIATPPWNPPLANNQGLWAPDGLYLNGQYYLYGSMWSSAKASGLILLTSPTLNPSSPDYKWTNHGVVVDGPAGVTHSVIDPAPIVDPSGNLWVVWGGGYPFATTADSIFLTALDNETGLALTSDPGYKPPNSPGYALEQGHKEGPYIHYHGGYYYLFYQTGSCCSGASSTYTIHVARSQSIKGPYSGDQTFYASKASIHGPGHMGVYSACGFERFTYHYYPDSGGSVIGENELVWGANGWPSVGAESTTPLKLCGSYATGGGGTSNGGAPGAGASSGGAPSAGDAGTFGGGGIQARAGSAGATGGMDPAGSGAPGNGGAPVAAGGSPATIGDPAGNGASSSPGGARTTPGSPDAGCYCRVGVGRSSNGVGGIWLLFGAALLVAARCRRSEG